VKTAENQTTIVEKTNQLMLKKSALTEGIPEIQMCWLSFDFEQCKSVIWL